MSNKPGDPIWYELITSDAEAAKAFYGKVIGWTAAAFPGGVQGYSVLSAGEVQVAGLMSNEKCPDMRPGWFGYVAVGDVDAKAAEAESLGGKVLMPPMDIPGVGRFALLADPQGAPFYVMKGSSDGTSHSFDQQKSGHANWNELSTGDQEGAFAFYGALFGWTKGGAMDMGPMGEYQFIHHGETAIGGCMRRPDPGPPPRWTYYFGVPDIQASAQAVTDGGGQVVHGPAEVPGGARIIIAVDPQGAQFGAVGPG